MKRHLKKVLEKNIGENIKKRLTLQNNYGRISLALNVKEQGRDNFIIGEVSKWS